MIGVTPGCPLAVLGGATVLVLSLAYLVYGGIQQGATYWMTVDELEQRAVGTLPAKVRLGGTVAPGSITWDASHRHLRFLITDGQRVLPVAYNASPCADESLWLTSAALRWSARWSSRSTLSPQRSSDRKCTDQRLSRALGAVAALEFVAAGVLLVALGTRDYAFRYASSHVSDAQPLLYNLTSFWGGMEGSLLVWGLSCRGTRLRRSGASRGGTGCFCRAW